MPSEMSFCTSLASSSVSLRGFGGFGGFGGFLHITPSRGIFELLMCKSVPNPPNPPALCEISPDFPGVLFVGGFLAERSLSGGFGSGFGDVWPNPMPTQNTKPSLRRSKPRSVRRLLNQTCDCFSSPVSSHHALYRA